MITLILQRRTDIINTVTSFIDNNEQLNNTKAAIFSLAVKLSGDFSFSKFIISKDVFHTFFVY